MEIKFKSIEDLGIFVDKFLHSEEGQVFKSHESEPYHLGIAMAKFINIHGHE